MKKTLISALQLEQLQAILAGHMHHFFEERFSPHRHPIYGGRHL